MTWSVRRSGMGSELKSGLGPDQAVAGRLPDNALPSIGGYWNEPFRIPDFRDLAVHVPQISGRLVWLFFS